MKLTEYYSVSDLQVDLKSIGVKKFDVDGRSFEIEVIDSINDYVALMKEIFDFAQLKDFLTSFKVVANGMHAGVFFSAKLFRDLFFLDFEVFHEDSLIQRPIREFLKLSLY